MKIKLKTRRFLVDAAERIGWTFGEAAAGTIVGAAVFDYSVVRSAAISGFIAVAALVKVTAASRIGKRGSAALLPASADK